MEWGEAQSVIQLAAALNAIYLGLRDIRNPYVRREQERLAQQAAEWKRLADSVPIPSQDLSQAGRAITDNQFSLTNKLHDFDRTDWPVGVSSAVFIALYIALLIVSAFCYHKTIANWLSYIICFAGYVPIGLGFLLNVLLILNLKSSVAARRREIDRQLAEIRTRAEA
jgi:hypothetical protein